MSSTFSIINTKYEASFIYFQNSSVTPFVYLYQMYIFFQKTTFSYFFSLFLDTKEGIVKKEWISLKINASYLEPWLGIQTFSNETVFFTRVENSCIPVAQILCEINFNVFWLHKKLPLWPFWRVWNFQFYWFLQFRRTIFIQKCCFQALELLSLLSRCGKFMIQILREINFGDSRSAKYAVLTHLEARNSDFHAFLHFLKTGIYQFNKIQCPKNDQKRQF